jgi:hypothetical protein
MRRRSISLATALSMIMLTLAAACHPAPRDTRDGLRLQVTVAAALTTVRLDNLDWFDFELTDAAGVTRILRVVSDRDESYPVAVDLAPGAALTHTVDLAGWARAQAAPLAPGRYQLHVVYEVAADYPEDAWKGRLDAAPVAIDL